MSAPLSDDELARIEMNVWCDGTLPDDRRLLIDEVKRLRALVDQQTIANDRDRAEFERIVEEQGMRIADGDWALMMARAWALLWKRTAKTCRAIARRPA